MEQALKADADWLAAPIVNRYTRLVAAMNPVSGELWAEGWERSGRATSARRLRVSP